MSKAHPDEFLVHDVLDGHVEAQRAFNRILARIAELEAERGNPGFGIPAMKQLQDLYTRDLASKDARIAELEAIADQLRDENVLSLSERDAARAQVAALLAALEGLVKDAQAAVDQDNPFLGQQLNDLYWHSIPAARAALAAAHQGEDR